MRWCWPPSCRKSPAHWRLRRSCRRAPAAEEFPARALSLGTPDCVNASSIFTVLSDANSDRQPARTTAWSSTIRTFVADLSDFCIIQPLAGKILRSRYLEYRDLGKRGESSRTLDSEDLATDRSLWRCVPIRASRY